MELIVDFPNRSSRSPIRASLAQAAGRDAEWPPEEVEQAASENAGRSEGLKPPLSYVTNEDDDDSTGSIHWKEKDRDDSLIVDFPRASFSSSSSPSKTACCSSSSSCRFSSCSSISSSEMAAAPAAPAPRVAFSDPIQVQIHFVENYALRYESDLWYTDSDDELFARERERDVAQIKLLERFGENYGAERGIAETMARYTRMQMDRAGTTTVGLEDFVGGVHVVEIAARRERHRRAVLEEQRRQRLLHERKETGCREEGREPGLDPEAIARVSKRLSEWARKRGELDGEAHAEGCRDGVMSCTPMVAWSWFLILQLK